MLRARDFTLVGFSSLALQDVADGAGVGSLTFGPVPPGYLWRVTLIVGSSSSAAASVIRGYVGEARRRNGTLYASAGNDFQDDTERVLGEGDSLLLRWTGATAGAEIAARMEYRIMQKAPPYTDAPRDDPGLLLPAPEERRDKVSTRL
jgi:hypothetical protein